MTDIRRIGDSGVHTVEGNVAGNRAARLTKEREKQRQEYEAVKSKIKLQHSAGAGGSLAQIDSNFVSSTSAPAPKGPAATSTDKAEELTEEERRELVALRAEVKKREKQRRKRKMAASLSFSLDEDGEGGEGEDGEQAQLKDDQKGGSVHKRKVAKNPDVDTSHLPDRGTAASRGAVWRCPLSTVVRDVRLIVGIYDVWCGAVHVCRTGRGFATAATSSAGGVAGRAGGYQAADGGGSVQLVGRQRPQEGHGGAQGHKHRQVP